MTWLHFFVNELITDRRTDAQTNRDARRQDTQQTFRQTHTEIDTQIDRADWRSDGQDVLYWTGPHFQLNDFKLDLKSSSHDKVVTQGIFHFHHLRIKYKWIYFERAF